MYPFLTDFFKFSDLVSKIKYTHMYAGISLSFAKIANFVGYKHCYMYILIGKIHAFTSHSTMQMIIQFFA